jgi:outer membrane protein OmpA-like peptidoglycan-associated protein
MKKILTLSAMMLPLLAHAAYAQADQQYMYPDTYQPPYQQQPYQPPTYQPQQQQAAYPAPVSVPCQCPQSCGQQVVYVPTPVYVTAQQQPMPQTTIATEDRTVYFGFNRRNLTQSSQTKLNSLAYQLNSATDITGARIVGYADRIGSVRYNEALSRQRAETVRTYLINHGLAKPSTTETRWVGKSEPSTHCSKYLPRAQLIQCLQPDRKVQVDIEYSTQQYPQPVIIN